MSKPAIVAENLGKRYRIQHQGAQGEGLRHVLNNAVQRPIKWVRSRFDGTSGHKEKSANPQREDFWALRDVSFSIQPGEVVGVIGRNGAGKSTLLKVLSRITEPTRGRVRINGRVASLLEVGTGFHGDLTGRENIYLNGTILGMSRREISKKFDEIIAFAEVEKFLDTPVKRYSSGMYVRLAFAIAAHLEPEILIVDEVLAVGDTQFQRKCLGKMQDVSQREGRTVLFVSHNMAAISTLTRRVILLRSGEVEYSGAPQEGINRYLEGDAASEAVYTAAPKASPSIVRAEVTCSENNQTQASGKAWSVTVRLHYPHPIHNAHLAVQVLNQSQTNVLLLAAYEYPISVCDGAGTTEIRCEVPKLDLNVGMYSLKIYLAEPPGGQVYDTVENACPFEVVMLDRTTSYGWRPEVCTYLIDSVWTKPGGG